MESIKNAIRLKGFHLALFLVPSQWKSVRVAGLLSEVLGDIFTGEPGILPLPIDAPAEIPRIVMNRENVAQLTISAVRADLHLGEQMADWSHINLVSGRLVDSIVGDLKLQVIRVGVVFVCEIMSDDPLRHISQRFLKPIDLMDELDLAWHDFMNVGNERCNRWRRFCVGPPLGGKRELIVDVNTLAEADSPRSAENIKEFTSSLIIQVGGDFDGVVGW